MPDVGRLTAGINAVLTRGTVGTLVGSTDAETRELLHTLVQPA